VVLRQRETSIRRFNERESLYTCQKNQNDSVLLSIRTILSCDQRRYEPLPVNLNYRGNSVSKRVASVSKHCFRVFKVFPMSYLYQKRSFSFHSFCVLLLMKRFTKGKKTAAKIAFFPRETEVCQSVPARFFSVLQGVSTLVSLWFLALFWNAQGLLLADSIAYLAPLELLIFVEKRIRDGIANGGHFHCKHGCFFVANGTFLQHLCCISSRIRAFL